MGPNGPFQQLGEAISVGLESTHISDQIRTLHCCKLDAVLDCRRQGFFLHTSAANKDNRFSVSLSFGEKSLSFEEFLGIFTKLTSFWVKFCGF